MVQLDLGGLCCLLLYVTVGNNTSNHHEVSFPFLRNYNPSLGGRLLRSRTSIPSLDQVVSTPRSRQNLIEMLASFFVSAIYTLRGLPHLPLLRSLLRLFLGKQSRTLSYQVSALPSSLLGRPNRCSSSLVGLFFLRSTHWPQLHIVVIQQERLLLAIPRHSGIYWASLTRLDVMALDTLLGFILFAAYSYT